MKYKLNVFLLQRYALRVQHWFFYKRLNQPKKSLQKTTGVIEELPKPAISTEKYKKLNGTQRIPKAAEKHLQKQVEEQKKKEAKVTEELKENQNKVIARP